MPFVLHPLKLRLGIKTIQHGWFLAKFSLKIIFLFLDRNPEYAISCDDQKQVPFLVIRYAE